MTCSIYVIKWVKEVLFLHRKSQPESNLNVLHIPTFLIKHVENIYFTLLSFIVILDHWSHQIIFVQLYLHSEWAIHKPSTFFHFILNLISSMIKTRIFILIDSGTNACRIFWAQMGPAWTRRAGSARHGRKPRVSEPKLVPTCEAFFLRFVAQNAAFAMEKKRNGALHRRANQKKFNATRRWVHLSRPAFGQSSEEKMAVGLI